VCGTTRRGKGKATNNGNKNRKGHGNRLRETNATPLCRKSRKGFYLLRRTGRREKKACKKGVNVKYGSIPL